MTMMPWAMHFRISAHIHRTMRLALFTRSFKMPLSHAMQVAWEDANMEVSVQNNARAKIVYIKALAKVGADRLIEMRNQIENIDRQSFEDKERLSEIRQAMLYV